jgi:hypothetical protein
LQGPQQLLPALHLALQEGNLEMVRLLLSATTDGGKARVEQRLLEVSLVSDMTGSCRCQQAAWYIVMAHA